MKRFIIVCISIWALSYHVHASNNFNFYAVAPSGQTLYYSYTEGVNGNSVMVTCPIYTNNPFLSSPYFGCAKPTGALIIPSSVTVSVDGMHSRTYSVTGIDQHTFFDCSGLTSVTIPNSVTTIGENAFYDCSGLTAVTIPNSVISIGSYAFYYCTGLTSVIIGNSVTSIGDHAFASCTGPTSIIIPNCVNFIGSSAFSGVRYIEYHGNAPGSPWDANSMNGVIDGDFVFTDNTKHYLLVYLGAGGDVTIPATVDTIGFRAFSLCSGLTSITIPNSVTSIGTHTFTSCSGLTTVTISNSVTSIGNYIFCDCSGLTAVNIPDGVTTIV